MDDDLVRLLLAAGLVLLQTPSLIGAPSKRSPQEPDPKQIKKFLDDLRESGVTNMLGAGPHIMEQFDVDKVTAKRLLVAWMESFGSEVLP